MRLDSELLHYDPDELLEFVQRLQEQVSTLCEALAVNHDCTARYGGGVGCSVCRLLAEVK